MPDKDKLTRQLHAFFKQGATKTYKRGELICKPYVFAQAVHFIESGFVKVVASTKEGHENILCILGPGDMFPFPGGFGLYKVEAFYIAMSALELKAMSSELLLHVVEHNLIVSQAIMWQLNNLLLAYSNRISTLALRSQRERMASFLLLLCERFGVEKDEETVLSIPITHSEIASSISSTRESVSRMLGTFTREGILIQRNRLIVIRNFAPLMATLQ